MSCSALRIWLTRECIMKWILVRLSVVILFVINCSPIFAGSTKTVFGLKYEQHFNPREVGTFYIQVAAFSHPSNAYRFQHNLQTRTKHPVIITHKKILYIVLVGPLQSAYELRKTANSLLEKTPHAALTYQTPSKPKPRSTQSKSPLPYVKRTTAISPTLNTTANWFLTLGGGAAFSLSKANINVDNGFTYPPPYNIDIYSTQSATSAILNLSVGRRWERARKWFPAYSLGLFYQHNFNGNVKGTLTQNSDPEALNYNYHWNISSDILLASAKLNLFTQKKFSPYVMAGLGGTWNHSNYNETALAGVTPRVSPDFSGTKGHFAYNAGGGIDFQASKRIIINAGYLYQSLGNISGNGRGTWAGTSLDLGSNAANEVLLGITYLFDQ